MNEQRMGQVDSTLALVAVLTAPNANADRIDVIAAWLLMVDGMRLDVKPEYWGPSIHTLQAQGLVFADMTSIKAIGNLRSIYEVPLDYDLAAEVAWQVNSK